MEKNIYDLLAKLHKWVYTTFRHMAQVKATTKYVLPKPHLALCILMTVMELGMCKNPPMTQLMI